MTEGEERLHVHITIATVEKEAEYLNRRAAEHLRSNITADVTLLDDERDPVHWRCTYDPENAQKPIIRIEWPECDTFNKIRGEMGRKFYSKRYSGGKRLQYSTDAEAFRQIEEEVYGEGGKEGFEARLLEDDSPLPREEREFLIGQKQFWEKYPPDSEAPYIETGAPRQNRTDHFHHFEGEMAVIDCLETCGLIGTYQATSLRDKLTELLSQQDNNPGRPPRP